MRIRCSLFITFVFHHSHIVNMKKMEFPSRRPLFATVVKESEEESQIFRDLPDAQPQGNLAKQLLEASSYREKRYGVVGNGG